MQFRDQVKILSTWFKDWNECEQTVALYSLMKKVKKHQAKFLLRCLEYGLQDCAELAPIEKEANDPNYLGQLLNETRQELVIEILQTHLPLLKPGNNQAKSCYLQLLPLVLTFAVDKSTYLQESRQILSYSLIHPAFDNKERTNLTSWLADLDGRIQDVSTENGGTIGPGCVSEGNDINQNPIRHHSDATSPSMWQHNSVQSSSLPSSHSSNGDLSTSGNNSLPNNNLDQEMSDINVWLKSLRLHKYAPIFSEMSYDEMMQLTEDQLTQKQITKGARNKFILNIQRLHERFKRLQDLEQEILNGGSIRSALTELRNMILTPIKKFEPPPDADSSEQTQQQGQPTSNKPMSGDIPGQFTVVMGKICTQLVLSKPDKENINTYMQLLDKCLEHPAFTEQSKQRLKTWKSQMNKNSYRPLPRNNISAQRSLIGYPGNNRNPNRNLLYPRGNLSRASPGSHPSPQLRNSQDALLGLSRQNMFMPGNTQSLLHHAKNTPTEAERKFATHPRLTTRQMYAMQGAEGGGGSQLNNEPDISGLSSLCMSVCEHALSGNDGQEGVSTL